MKGLKFSMKWYTTSLLCATSVFIYADQNLLAPNLSTIADEFGFSDRERDQKLGGYIALGFFVVGAPAALLIGYLADVLNRCYLFGIVVAFGEGACMTTYWAKTYPQLFFCRVLTGISIGGATPIIFSLLGDLFPGTSRIHVSSLVGIAMSAGIAFGQLLAGLIGPSYGWRLPFLLVAIPALILATLFSLTVIEPKRGDQEKEIQKARNKLHQEHHNHHDNDQDPQTIQPHHEKDPLFNDNTSNNDNANISAGLKLTLADVDNDNNDDKTGSSKTKYQSIMPNTSPGKLTALISQLYGGKSSILISKTKGYSKFADDNNDISSSESIDYGTTTNHHDNNSINNHYEETKEEPAPADIIAVKQLRSRGTYHSINSDNNSYITNNDYNNNNNTNHNSDNIDNNSNTDSATTTTTQAPTTVQYKETIDCKKLYQLFTTYSAIIIFVQGLPGCIPWGMIYVFLNDYFSDDRGMTIEAATATITFFGIGGFIGQFIGGWMGQQLYNKDPRYQNIFMGCTTILSVFPILYIINTSHIASSGFYFISLFGGFLVSINGPNVRVVLQNVCAPEIRGSAFAVFTLFDDIGKGLGPAIVVLFIEAMHGNRRKAFNVIVLFWNFCGLMLLLLAFTVIPDEQTVQSNIKQSLLRRSMEHFESANQEQQPAVIFNNNNNSNNNQQANIKHDNSSSNEVLDFDVESNVYSSNGDYSEINNPMNEQNKNNVI